MLRGTNVQPTTVGLPGFGLTLHPENAEPNPKSSIMRRVLVWLAVFITVLLPGLHNDKRFLRNSDTKFFPN